MLRSLAYMLCWAFVGAAIAAVVVVVAFVGGALG